MSECAVNDKLTEVIKKINDTDNISICVSNPYIMLLSKILKKISDKSEHSVISNLDKKGLILYAMDKLKVNSEQDIWQHQDIVNLIGPGVCKYIIKIYYKPKGPADSNKLLSNRNIDALLSSYEMKSEKLHNIKFKHIPFQMIDFMKYRTELADLDYLKLAENYDSFGVVLNSDISSGAGKHWFAIYCDLRKIKLDKTIIIEYFNSSGRVPYQEILDYYEYLKSKYIRDGIKVILEIVAKTRIQYSKTECGVFSLIFIIGRIEGNSTEYFNINNLKDADMARYRKLIFSE